MKENRFLLAATIVCLAVCTAGRPVYATSDGQMEVGVSAQSSLSPPLRSLALPLSVSSAAEQDSDLLEVPIHEPDRPPVALGLAAEAPDPVVQDWFDILAVPVPETSFDGIHNVNWVLPPDPSGDVGPNHYVQAVNLSIAVWDKEGNQLLGPLAGNALFQGFGGICESTNNGDPIVLYDPLADRWLYSQFALGFPDNFHQCIAISETPDPTGSWYRYDFKISSSKMNDYPKFGVWPDGYYMTVNQFDGRTYAWAGQGVVAFERDKMLQGLPAAMIYVDLYSQEPYVSSVLPADLDGANPPPVGTPNYFITFDDDSWGYPYDRLDLWAFQVDWDDPGSSTFERVKYLATDPFTSSLCGGSRSCIPQPDTSVQLDAISGRLMFRLAYRNFGTHEAMVVNHTVDADGADHAGIRWYELRNATGLADDWEVHQQGTYAPDGDHRWMGSVAMDGAGNIAVGYAVSGPSTYPSVRYAGRLATDPLGVLQAEESLVEGGGYQYHSSSRFGDYSAMVVDPSDDCTFWYTQEYIPSTTYASWRTRIGAFRFPDCTNDPVGEIDGRVTQGGLAVEGATVTAGAFSAMSDASGDYRVANLLEGTYDVTASAYGYASSTEAAVAVTDGGTTTVDFVLTPIPDVVVRGTVTDGSGWGIPLYARIDISGYSPGPVYTDPLTGEYIVDLPEGSAHTFTVSAVSAGYDAVVRGVTAPAGGGTEDFTLTVTAACEAPGYELAGLSCDPLGGGLVVGHVYDANSSNPLMGASVTGPDASAVTVAVPDDPAVLNGFYILYATAGDNTITATKSGYGEQSEDVAITYGQVSEQDFTLPAAQLIVTHKDTGEDATKGVNVTLYPGAVQDEILLLNNGGTQAVRFELKELLVPATAPEATGPFAEAGRRTSPKHLVDSDASSVRYYEPPDAGVIVGGDLIDYWPTDLDNGWGIGFDMAADDFWVGNSSSEGGDGLDYRFDVDLGGTGISKTAETIDTTDWATVFAADMAYDPWTGTLWQVNVGGNNCIYELDPDFVVQAATGEKICPAFGSSQRGLAYDWHTETFYSGSWNDQILYHFDKAGTILDSKAIGLNVAGLAFNPTTRHLFLLTNAAEGLDVYVLDVDDYYEVVGGFHIDRLGDYDQAGLELDCEGRLWAVDKNDQEVILADSGESVVCEFTGDNDPIPWLTESPVTGVTEAAGSAELTFTFDATDLPPGEYEGQVKLRNDSPYGTLTVPVTLAVLERHTITADAGQNGSILPAGTVDVLEGGAATFTVTPDPGFHVEGLLVDGDPLAEAAGTDRYEYTFSDVTADHTIVATFSDAFVITAVAGPYGSIDPSGEVAVVEGDSPAFTITPDPGNLISDVLVDGASVGAVGTYTFANVTKAHTIEARFEPITCTITTNEGANGTIVPSGAVIVNHGSSKTFTISAILGHRVEDVQVDGASVGDTSTYTFSNVTEDHTIGATFAIRTYSLTPIAGSHGSISPASEVTVEHGEDHTFQVDPDAGYEIADVKVDGISAGPVSAYTFENVTADHTIVALFREEGSGSFIMIMAQAVGSGSITPSGQVIVAEGAAAGFTFAPEAGHEVTNVIVDGQSMGAASAYTFFNVTANHNIVAVFGKPDYMITASATGNGSISPAGNVFVDRGADKIFTITAEEGYEIADLIVDGASVGPLASYTFANVNADHTIQAVFRVADYAIQATAVGNGRITPVGTVTVVHGESRKFEMAPMPFHEVVDVTIDGESVGALAEYTFESVSADHTITAVFNVIEYTILATVNRVDGKSSHGVIDPSGALSVPHGADKAFTMTPAVGYYIVDVSVDGTSLGAVSEYTFQEVTAAHTINVDFARGEHTITPIAGEGGAITPSTPQTVLRGMDWTFAIVPDLGYHIEDVLVDGESVGVVESFTFNVVTSDHTIEAAFAAQMHIITTKARFGDLTIDGFVIRSGGFTEDDPALAEFTVRHGENITFAMQEAHPKFLIKQVIVDGVAQPKVEKSYTFRNVTEDHTIEAVLNDVVQTVDDGNGSGGGGGGGGSGFGCFIGALTSYEPRPVVPAATGDVVLRATCALGSLALGGYARRLRWRREGGFGRGRNAQSPSRGIPPIRSAPSLPLGP